MVSRQLFMAELQKTFDKMNEIQEAEIALNRGNLPNYTEEEIGELNETVPLGTQEGLRSRLLNCLIELNKFCNIKFPESKEGDLISQKEMDLYKNDFIVRLHKSGVPYDYCNLAADAKDLTFMTVINSDIYKQSKYADKSHSIIAEEYYKYKILFSEKEANSILLDAQRNIPMSYDQQNGYDRILKQNGVDIDKFHKQINDRIKEIKKANFGELSLREYHNNFKREYDKLNLYEEISFKSKEKLDQNDRARYEDIYSQYSTGKYNKVSANDKKFFEEINNKYLINDRYKQVNKENKLAMYSQLKTLLDTEEKPKFWQIGKRFRMWRCNNLLSDMKNDMIKQGITSNEIDEFAKNPYNPDHFDREDQNKLDYENMIYEQNLKKAKTETKDQIKVEERNNSEKVKESTERQLINTAVDMSEFEVVEDPENILDEDLSNGDISNNLEINEKDI